VLCASGQAKGIAVTTGPSALAGLAVEDTTAVPIGVAVIGAVLVPCSALLAVSVLLAEAVSVLLAEAVSVLLAEAVSVLLDVGTAVDSDRGIASIVVVDVKVLVSVSLDTIILL
jgi:hypothetical protein